MIILIGMATNNYKNLLLLLKKTKLIVNKITNSCNLYCRYCSADSSVYCKDFMQQETFRKSVDFILNITEQPRVVWIFHGGEPLLLGWRWFYDSISYARKKAQDKNVIINFGLVTNGTLINGNNARLLKDENVTISVSLDGPPEINDIYRAQGKNVLNALNLIRNIGSKFRILGLINNANWDKFEYIINFFIKEGIHHTKFNLCAQAGRCLYEKQLSPQKAFIARKAILNSILNNPSCFCEVNIIHLVLKYFDAYPILSGAGCTTIRCGAANGFLGIRYDGTVFPCGRADDLGDSWKLMNIYNRYKSKNIIERISEYHSHAKRSMCYSCLAAKVCDFPCPAYQIASFNNINLQCGVSHLLLNYLDNLSNNDKKNIKTTLNKIHNALPSNLRT